jgi:KaiC/GvpD/RAD55 family RecA-like ATPase
MIPENKELLVAPDLTAQKRYKVGIDGLNELLNGGLISNRAYLIRGGPGCGKTTLGLHFLTTGSSQGESCLFITLGESAEQIRTHAEGFRHSRTGLGVGTKFTVIIPAIQDEDQRQL